eukprot:4847428-Prymnesium_polylepis.1
MAAGADPGSRARSGCSEPGRSSSSLKHCKRGRGGGFEGHRKAVRRVSAAGEAGCDDRTAGGGGAAHPAHQLVNQKDLARFARRTMPRVEKPHAACAPIRHRDVKKRLV